MKTSCRANIRNQQKDTNSNVGNTSVVTLLDEKISVEEMCEDMPAIFALGAKQRPLTVSSDRGGFRVYDRS